jgi:predicted phosphate transport protein (TIGR00153 family)
MGTERFYPVLRVKKGQEAIERFSQHIEHICQCVEGVKKNVEALCNGEKEEIQKTSQEVFSSERKADVIARDMMKTFAVGELRPKFREDLLRILFYLEQIGRFAEECAFETTIGDVSCLDEESQGLLKSMASNSYLTVRELSKAIRELTYNLDLAVEYGNKVAEFEDKVDKDRRRLIGLITMAGSKLETNMPNFLSINRLIEALEEVADSAEDTADLIRVLAISYI